MRRNNLADIPLYFNLKMRTSSKTLLSAFDMSRNTTSYPLSKRRIY